MIKHRKKIVINANIEKVWFFMINFSRSLIFDRNYTLIELPSNYSVNNELQFKIHAKYLMRKIQMYAEIKKCTPPLNLELHCIKNNGFTFNHVKIFDLKSINEKTQLCYTVKGEFHNFIFNIFYSPILKLAFNLELEYIKKAIESSEIHTTPKKLHTLVK